MENCPSFKGEKVEQKSSLKFLGVNLDEHLTWKNHIEVICNKISKAIGIIYKARFLLPPKTRLSLYYSLIYPYIYYCNVICSSTYPSNLNRILLLQKRIVRIIANADYRAQTKPLFKRLKILDIYDLHTLCIANFMFEYHHNLLPSCFDNLFLRNNQVHKYGTRNSTNYYHIFVVQILRNLLSCIMAQKYGTLSPSI